MAERYLLDANGAKLGRSGPGDYATAWLLTDRLGSVRDVLDVDGNLADSISYDPSGNMTVQSNANWTGMYTYAGMMYDGIVQTLMSKYRFMLPDGQWSSPDLAGYSAGDSNTRRMDGNDGTNSIDPSGLDRVYAQNDRYVKYYERHTISSSVTFDVGEILRFNNSDRTFVKRLVRGNWFYAEYDQIVRMGSRFASNPGSVQAWDDWFASNGLVMPSANHPDITETTAMRPQDMQSYFNPNMSVGQSMAQAPAMMYQAAAQVTASVAGQFMPALGRLAAPVLARGTNWVLNKAIHQSFIARTSLHNPLSWAANKLGFQACFAGETKLLTRGPWGEGYRRIDEITLEDEVASRNEFDVNGPVEWKQVEELFQRTGCLVHLHVGGQVIRTTAEHPFFEYSKGWTAAAKLEEGDRLATLDGNWVKVEEVYDIPGATRKCTISELRTITHTSLATTCGISESGRTIVMEVVWWAHMTGFPREPGTNCITCYSKKHFLMR